MHVIACFCTYIRRPNLEHNTQNRNLSRKKQRKSGLKPESQQQCNNNGAVVTETEHPKPRAQQKTNQGRGEPFFPFFQGEVGLDWAPQKESPKLY